MAESSKDKKLERTTDSDNYSKKLSALNNDITAMAYLNQRLKTIHRISTGSKIIDNMLRGGIETNAVTELYGASNSGKTQFCHTLTAIVSQDEPKGGINGKSIYIDTEGTFSPERIIEIAKARGFDPANTLENIIVRQPADSTEQERMLENINSSLSNDRYPEKFKLIVVDSPITHYRAEYIGRQMLSKRQQKLYRFMHSLRIIAQKYSIAAVVTNQIHDVTDSEKLETEEPLGGHAMAHSITYGVHLRSRAFQVLRTAAIVTSPYHTWSSKEFSISEKGIEDKL